MRRVSKWCAVVSVVTLGCNGEDGGRPNCIDLAPSCDPPLYPPEFQAVFSNTLSRSCAQAGGACHGPQGRKGGLVFSDIEESYALLVAQNGGKARVTPGKASCSELIVRLESVGEEWQMPPGTPLSAAERCAIRQWVDLGALRE